MGSGSPQADLMPPDAPARADARLTVWVTGFGGALEAGLREVISRDEELAVLAPAEELDLHTVMTRHRPHAVLLKAAALSNTLDLRRLVVTYPSTGVVVGVVRLSTGRDQALLAAGARMVVPLTMGPEELCTALRLVALRLVGPPRVTRARPSDDLGALTTREREVFFLLARRRTAREIAAALHIATPTVHTHTRRIYEKLGVHSRAELEAWAVENSAGEDTLDDAALLSRDRVPYGRRAAPLRNMGRPSAFDMRAAMGIARWPRAG
jgi:DNA-binding NarL/FixJ family response regulator